MEGEEKKLFKYLSHLEPTADLSAHILVEIKNREKKLVQRQTFLFGLGSALSLVLGLFLVVSLGEMFVRSGLSQYLALLFSGDSVVYTYWRELAFSLLDSLPIFGLITFLVTLGFFIWSTANTVTVTRRLVLIN